MDKTILVKVTQADIDKGCLGDAENCPIARAAVRAMGHTVRVGRVRITWDTDSSFYKAKLPPEARYFISDFDRRNRVYPFEFEITPELAYNFNLL